MNQTAANVLWAKKPIDMDSDTWLPLCVHMADSAQIAAYLWENWIPRTVRNAISQGIAADIDGYEIAREMLAFLGCVHDIGKASPIFQNKRSRALAVDEQIRQSIIDAGLPLQDNYTGNKETRHSLVSHAILKRNGFHDTVAVIAGGHHGIPPSSEQIKTLPGYQKSCGFNNSEWISVQDQLLSNAIDMSELTLDVAKNISISYPAQVLLSGLVILIDWIASDTKYFPLLPLEKCSADSERRAQNAFKELKLPDPWITEDDWDGLYQRRFNIIRPRPIQIDLLRVVKNIYKPGIFVIEAPMGEGKTESALIAAEILSHNIGCRGIYFALPTQATSNAMFERVLDWMESFDSFGEKYSVRLTHGRAEFNELYSDIKLSGQISIGDEIDEGHSMAIVHEWLCGRKKGMLADFAVGTVDHILMMGLKQKHLALRHLGLAGKVMIIDECHAYDVYMESYLLKAINWLGVYGVPVIILSATLPPTRRQALIEAYLPKHKITDNADRAQLMSYPLITYTDGGNVRYIHVPTDNKDRELTVDISHICEDDVFDTLEKTLTGGGCAGVVVNTVKRAQKLYELALERFAADEVRLLHAAFLGSDRAKSEIELLELLGPPEKAKRPERLVVIGTQIFEQSIDIDFDILISDLCPIDLLLQRIGRLHRHKRAYRAKGVSKATCYIMGTEWGSFESGSEAVYGRYLLMRTRAMLPDKITLPRNISELVATVYDENIKLPIPEENLPDYDDAKTAWEKESKGRKNRSKAFQINEPNIKGALIGWLDTHVADDSEKRAEAAVRDGADSLEVVIIQRKNDELALLPWIENGMILPRTTPDEKTAKIIAGCYVRLPILFSKTWMVDSVIESLESTMREERITVNWYKSRWLKGILCLIIDENMEVDLCGYHLIYDRNLGLKYEKQEV